MTSDQPTPPGRTAADAESRADAQIEAQMAERVGEGSFDGVSLRRRILNVRTIGSLLFGLLLLFLLFRVVFGEDFDWGEVLRLIGDADPTFLLLAFFAWTAWRYRAASTAVGQGALLTVLLLFWYMFFYVALMSPLAVTMIAVALLWRREEPVPGRRGTARTGGGAW